MIRDPSDGSVKSAPAPLSSLPSGESDPVVTQDCAGAGTSGLRAAKPSELARLEKARDWLKGYYAKQGSGK